MADPSPAEGAEGQEPETPEGQEPETGNDDDSKKEPEKESKSYPESYVRQLRREAAVNRTRVAELEDQLKEHEDADKSEQEKLVEKVGAAESRAVQAETKLLRYEVAQERGLDLAAAEFLAGTTREEIEHRADELAKLLEGQDKPSAGFDGGARMPAPEKGPPEQEHNDFLLRAMGRQPASR
jgi:hypothetical protein